MKFKIKNWKRHQHYKKRNPPWVKLHYEILTSKDWVMLADASKLLAIVCILVASRDNGVFDGDVEYIQKVGQLKQRPDLKPLIHSGFIEMQADASNTLANACTKTETETELKPPISPFGGLDGFDIFWKAYPKKIGKGGAEKVWKKLKPSKKLIDVMLTSISLQAHTEQWKKENGQFIPMPSTWLNQKRWEDEVETNKENRLPSWD